MRVKFAVLRDACETVQAVEDSSGIEILLTFYDGMFGKLNT